MQVNEQQKPLSRASFQINNKKMKEKNHNSSPTMENDHTLLKYCGNVSSRINKSHDNSRSISVNSDQRVCQLPSNELDHTKTVPDELTKLPSPLSVEYVNKSSNPTNNDRGKNTNTYRQHQQRVQEQLTTERILSQERFSPRYTSTATTTSTPQISHQIQVPLATVPVTELHRLNESIRSMEIFLKASFERIQGLEVQVCKL